MGKKGDWDESHPDAVERVSEGERLSQVGAKDSGEIKFRERRRSQGEE